MIAIAQLIDWIVQAVILVFVANAVMSWLVAFNVIDPNNSIVRQIGYFLWRVTEPALAPIRRVLPSFGGIDFSPIVVILGLALVNNHLIQPALRSMGA